jgi:hypothetical protein
MAMGSGVVGQTHTGNPILDARAAQVEVELEEWAKRVPTFDFDPSGTDLFSLMELAYAFSKRAAEFSRVIRNLMADQQLVPAAIMARALTETVAMGCLYLHDMERLTAAGDQEKLSARLMKFYAGVREHDIKPVHVNDAMRHLEKIDEAYFNDLATRYPLLAYAKAARARQAPPAQTADDEGLPLVSRNYALLCEVAHPNGLGTQYLYGVPDPRFDGRALRDRLAFLSVAAIWQCHHLMRALTRGESLPENFKAKLLTGRG